MTDSIKAYLLEGTSDSITGSLTQLDTSQLPEGEVTIKVVYSSINYKDAMINQGVGGMVRTFPHVPGVDFSGEVISDSSGRFQPGDQVSVTGQGTGISHFGGYAEQARVPADWVVKLPAGLDAREASILGTAGLTAMLAVIALENNGLTPEKGPVLVTGSTGGVGSVAIDILAGAGYEVVASSGKADMHEYLKKLGASRVVSREEVVEEAPKVLLKEQWAAAVDQVGGPTTEYLVRAVQHGGSVALTGMTHGVKINTTVYPFILRNVGLLGIDSVNCPMEKRKAAWEKLATTHKPRFLNDIAKEISLEGLPSALEEILAGGAKGRYLVKI